MANSGSVFSQTLQEITTTKLEELAKKRKSFEDQRASTVQNADSQHDSLQMLTALADGIKACFSIATKDGKVVRGSGTNPRLETDLRNLNRFIDQARFDPSVSAKFIRQWREALLKHLDVQSLKYQYADLYGQLTVEWLESSSIRKQGTTNDADGDKMDLSEDFEEIAVRRKVEAREAWEKTVFEEAKVDQAAINTFLNGLFGSKESKKALKRLRQDFSSIEASLSSNNQFNHTTLRWCIKGLLSSDRLTNEKRQVLRDFQSNDVILTELADVLNMRMAAPSAWSWGDEVPVEARRQMSGKFNIYLHEDVLQSIFLQYIGVKWSTMAKAALMRFQGDAGVWNNGRKQLSPLDKQRRAWYLGSSVSGLYVQQVRNLTYRGGYFVSQLMNDAQQDLDLEEGDEEADFAEFSRVNKRKAGAPAMMAVQAASKSHGTGGAMRHRRILADEECKEEAEDSDEDMGFDLMDDEPSSSDLTPYKPKNPMDAKQRLLHLLSTEILVKTRIQGEITCVRSQYGSWYSSLPHATISTVLTFLGVSEQWSKFFRAFLEAPMKFMDEDEEPRIRKRGTPGAHVISEFFGEMVLFCLDFTVNQQAEGEFLWRMHDDIWFWSASHEKCMQVWDTIQHFNKTMGVHLDEDKSAAVRMQRQDGKIVPAKLDKSLPKGEIRWGMIFLDNTTGKFTIDEKMVDKHIEELRKQLKDKEKAIFAWVQAYSTYASVFFTSNFGQPANCFGRQHIDNMLSMHERIQKTLFAKSGDEEVQSVVDWLKKQIEVRFGVKNLPDGYLFFPAALGGLDVKSPFIGLLQLRDSVVQDPDTLLDEFKEAEQEQYDQLKKTYYEQKKWEYPPRDKEYRPDDPQEFMSFEEFAKFREDVDYNYTHQLRDIYIRLQKRPVGEPLETDHNSDLMNALQRVRWASDRQPETITGWYQMDPYWKWVVMLYGPEMVETFGGFEIVDSGLLPMGMVSLFKSGRVSWQE